MARPKIPTYTVAVERGLNLRAEPSKDAPVLAILEYGEKVKADTERDSSEDWLAVLGGGYVMREYLH